MKKRFWAMALTMILLFTTVVPVFADATVTISKNSITIQSGDTYQLNVLVDGTITQATAWGSSDTSVAEVSSDGLVTGKAAGSAVITAMVNGTSVECIVSVVKKSTTKTTRYNVLILDTSGSVKGTPLDREKEAAKRFCKAVLNSDGNNYLAIVTLNSSPTVLCNFTNKLSTLKKKINSVKAKGGTNMNAALKKAGDLLDKKSGGTNVMKNIILCSDGLPESGTKSASGRYTASDYSDYKYANSTYKTDVKLKNKNYFVYALGFFHNSTGKELEFGKRLMKDLASKDKYYIVTDTKDIDKVFDDIANKITKTVMNQSSITLYVGETYQLNVQVNGATKSATWKSSKSSIASVNSSGKVTAKKVGTTTITGTVNGKSATCKVTVKKKPVSASIKLNKTAITLYVKETATLKATVTGSSKSVSWSSSNKSVVTVSKGKIKGIKKGTATITAKANGLKATCKVTVVEKHPKYSFYITHKKTTSIIGSKKINESGSQVVYNEGGKITKCGVYIYKQSGYYYFIMACTGTNLTSVQINNYLGLNGKIVYDSYNTAGQSRYMTRFSLYKDSSGVWSMGGNYGHVRLNATDSSGNLLVAKNAGADGKNVKVFSDLSKMKAWLQK